VSGGPDRVAGEATARGTGELPTGTRPMWTLPTRTPTRLVLVRHGSTAHSPEKRFSGRNELPLTAAGRAQAAALARRAPTFGAVTAVISSPLLRARQTAEVVAAALGLPVEIDDDLAELDFGTWEGLTFGQACADDASALDAWLASPDVAPPGGESFTALARRVGRGRDSVIAAHPRQTVVVVTHVSPIKTLLRIALDAPPSSMYRIHLDIASVSRIDYYPGGNCSVGLVNDTSHLA
jgi:ribonuclease H / adenosylcobalamin/alpha-ribazole phosphatase